MAERIFKGRLITTGDIHDENVRAFPEASEDFEKPHKGGLEPYHLLYNILKSVEDAMADPNNIVTDAVRIIDGSIFVRGLGEIGAGLWIKIDPDGSFEIGTSGV